MAQSLLHDYRLSLISLCEQVASFIKKELNQVSTNDIEEKDMNSLVSYVDKKAERMIVTALNKLTPNCGFITEEDTPDDRDKSLTWIIDPLDGTTNFLHKIPHFSISIALMEKEEVTLGIVYDVMLDISYTAIKGFGAWENGNTIKVNDTKDLSKSIVVTGFPYKKDNDIDASLRVLKYCVMNCRGLRRLGSAALDLAYVASGKIDIYYENCLNIWDLAAGALLVEEAGGRMTDYNGDRNYHNTCSIIASNPHLYDDIAAVIQKEMTDRV